MSNCVITLLDVLFVAENVVYMIICGQNRKSAITIYFNAAEIS